MGERKHDRRSGLGPVEGAVSEALDELNHRMHGMTSSWSYPEEFLDFLRDRGYAVVSVDKAVSGFHAAIGDATTPRSAMEPVPQVRRVQIAVELADGQEFTMTMRDVWRVGVETTCGPEESLGSWSAAGPGLTGVDKLTLEVQRPQDVRAAHFPAPTGKGGLPAATMADMDRGGRR